MMFGRAYSNVFDGTKRLGSAKDFSHTVIHLHADMCSSKLCFACQVAIVLLQESTQFVIPHSPFNRGVAQILLVIMFDLTIQRGNAGITTVPLFQ